MKTTLLVLAACFIISAIASPKCNLPGAHTTKYSGGGLTKGPTSTYFIGQDSLCQRNPNVVKRVWLSTAWAGDDALVTCGLEVTFTIAGVQGTAFVSGYGSFAPEIQAPAIEDDCGLIAFLDTPGKATDEVIWSFTGKSAKVPPPPPKR